MIYLLAKKAGGGREMRNPCKHCGARPVKKVAPALQLMWLQCKNCKSKNMTTMEYNMESAIAKWNERNPLSEKKE